MLTCVCVACLADCFSACLGTGVGLKSAKVSNDNDDRPPVTSKISPNLVTWREDV